MLRNGHLIYLILLLLSSAQAKIWYVDSNPGHIADFTSPQAANDAATVVSGDTLYLMPSFVSYGDIIVTKTLVFIGPGYFLLENQINLKNPATALLGTVTFESSAEGAKIFGTSISSILIKADNVAIIRNYLWSGAQYVIKTENASNILILQNYITCGYNNNYNNNTCYAIYNYGSGGNIEIQSNIIHNAAPKTSRYSIYSTKTSNIKNNIFLTGMAQIYNCIVQNNIFVDATSMSIPSSAVFNISCGGGLPIGNGNQMNIPVNSIFILSGSPDGQYQLKSGSPAIGAGINGEDIGAFGGPDPYVLSGLPATPVIYDITAPLKGTTTGGLPVTIKVKTQK